VNELKIEVLTPQEQVFAGTVDAVVLPIADGWIGILPGHTPFAARLLPGQVVIRIADDERLLATIGGIVALQGETLRLLTGAAALDRDLATLEQEVRAHFEELAAAEREAEKHFERVYRQLAGTFARRPKLDQ
jgi:F-type H+-transporting ATPase subunit epsilon